MFSQDFDILIIIWHYKVSLFDHLVQNACDVSKAEFMRFVVLLIPFLSVKLGSCKDIA